MNVSVGKGTISKGVVIFQPSFFRGFEKGSFQGGFFYFGSEIYVKKDWIFQDFLVDLTFFNTPKAQQPRHVYHPKAQRLLGEVFFFAYWKTPANRKAVGQVKLSCWLAPLAFFC